MGWDGMRGDELKCCCGTRRIMGCFERSRLLLNGSKMKMKLPLLSGLSAAKRRRLNKSTREPSPPPPFSHRPANVSFFFFSLSFFSFSLVAPLAHVSDLSLIPGD
jgi:hypothetical protein